MKSKQIIIVIIILINVQINGYKQEKSKPICGKRLVNHNALVTHGTLSQEGDWPWHAAIFHYKNKDIAYRCGGTVLNSNSILTAAHCVYENNQLIIPERVIVQLGKYDLKFSGPYTQEFEVYRIISHPAFTTSELRNDIAIIRLSTEATFNDYVQPICLWERNKVAISTVTKQLGTVIGWGFTEEGQISHTLRQTVMPVVSLTTCLNSNRDVFGRFLSNNNFCAGFKNGTSVCNGDSGGSMTFEENGVYRIRGVVSLTVAQSHADVCNSKEYVLFTDVAKYLNWIEEEVPQLPSKLESIQNLPSMKTEKGKQFVLGTLFKANWYKAFQFCKINKMELATISSKEEDEAIAKLIYTNGTGLSYFWTSGNDLAENRNFFWMSTGEPFTYTGWLHNEPNDVTSKEHCVHIWQNDDDDGGSYGWNDLNCNVEMYFICQRYDGA